MALVVVRGSTHKPVAAEALIAQLEQHVDEGELYIGYPIIGTADGRLAIDALLVSPKHGVVVFDLIEGTDATGYEDRQDEAANILESKLRSHKDLVDKRRLIVDIAAVSFGPGLQKSVHGEYPVTQKDVWQFLSELSWSDYSTQAYNVVKSALQNISTIRHSRTRRITNVADSRGTRLKRLEESIATLDSMQSRAVIETAHGVQRIRGLAGSGKTIVLALKAAYLHSQHPDWRIAVTFHSRSLKAQFKKLINMFCISATGEEPEWEKLRVISAWGAPGSAERSGLYYEFCREHALPYHDFNSAKAQYGAGHAFAGACSEAIDARTSDRPLYDAILVDEAQDFPTQFLQLCYFMLSERRHLVYAYDELQNLGGESLPSPETIFGSDGGVPRVSFHTGTTGPKQDIILQVCYRNSRPVLSTAHALGFGVYRQPDSVPIGLVQMFDDPRLWTDVGYDVAEGELTLGQHVKLVRSEETSPIFLEAHSAQSDLISFQAFPNAAAQNQWVAEQIQHNLEHDELREEDIVVINPDPLTTRDLCGPIRKRLLEAGIESHIAGVTTDPDVFFQPDKRSITFSGVFRAKGNEAGMVYIVNAEDCFRGHNIGKLRNRLFTAITRSKAWVRVVGVGPMMEALIKEFDMVRLQGFGLDFVYPTAEQLKLINVVPRDIAPEQRRRYKGKATKVRKLLEQVENGTFPIEKLDPHLLDMLSEYEERGT